MAIGCMARKKLKAVPRSRSCARRGPRPRGARFAGALQGLPGMLDRLAAQGDAGDGKGYVMGLVLHPPGHGGHGRAGEGGGTGGT